MESEDFAAGFTSGLINGMADKESSSFWPARELPAGREPTLRTLALGDGYETGVYVHEPPGRPNRLPVLYVHGIQSHPGWFAGSACALADRGHTVFQPVRRGSGDNRRGRGHARSARQLLRDVEAAGRLALRETGAKRLHLVGVSWGGKLLACYAGLNGGIAVASLTMVAPGIVPRVDVSLWTKLRIAACLLFAPRASFEIPLSDVELFTDNEAMRQYLRDDPFRLRRATGSFLYASRTLDRMLRRLPDGALAVPTTLILAARDRIIDNNRTRKVVDRLTDGRAVVEEFQTAHVLEFEPDPTPCYEAIAAGVARGEQ